MHASRRRLILASAFLATASFVGLRLTRLDAAGRGIAPLDTNPVGAATAEAATSRSEPPPAPPTSPIAVAPFCEPREESNGPVLLRGRVLFDDGTAVPFARIVADAIDGTWADRIVCDADDAGLFAVRSPRASRTWIEIRERGWEPPPCGNCRPEVPEWYVTRVVGATPSDGGWVVEPGAEIEAFVRRLPAVRGRLLDREGRPMDVLLGLRLTPVGAEESASTGSEAMTWDDGRFELCIPIDGKTFSEEAVFESGELLILGDGLGDEAGDCAPSARVRFGGGAERSLDLGDVVVDRRGSLAFLVTDEDDRPLPGATIFPAPPQADAWAPRLRRSTDADGRGIWRIGRDQGRFRVVARGYADQTIRRDRPDRLADSEFVHVRMFRGATCAVCLPEAFDASGISARLTDLRGEPLSPTPPTGEVEDGVRRFGAGNTAVFDHLATGSAGRLVLFDALGPVSDPLEPAPFAEGERRTVRPAPFGRVKLIVRVFDADGSPPAPATVLLILNGNRCLTRYVDAEGCAHFDGLRRDLTVSIAAHAPRLAFRSRTTRLDRDVVEVVLRAEPWREVRLRFNYDPALGGRPEVGDLAATADGLAESFTRVGRAAATTHVAATATVVFTAEFGGRRFTAEAPPGVDDVAILLPALGEVRVTARSQRVSRCEAILACEGLGGGAGDLRAARPVVLAPAPRITTLTEGVFLSPGRYRVRLFTANSDGKPRDLLPPQDVVIDPGATTVVAF